MQTRNIIVAGASAGAFKAITKLVSRFKKDLEDLVYSMVKLCRKKRVNETMPHIERLICTNHFK